MSKIEIELCGCCERVVDGDNKNWLSVVVKHSEGAFGKSQTLFNNNSTDELCDECYDEMIDYLRSFVNHWENRRGNNRPKEVKL